MSEIVKATESQIAELIRLGGKLGLELKTESVVTLTKASASLHIERMRKQVGATGFSNAPTDSQKTYITSLVESLGIGEYAMPATKQEASAEIERLKGLVDASADDLFSSIV